LELRQEAGPGLRSAAIADGRLTLVLNNTLAAVEAGRGALLEFLGPLDPMAQNRLEVVFEELVTNTIRHGFKPHSDQSIHVRVERTASAVELVFEDDGEPFNPLDAAMPEAFTDIEHARIGGLGIPLIVKLSSGLRYERLTGESAAGFRPNNRTTVSVVAP
jgi:anti-sigma regulatory factor (Ser/Thr protein kinase)